MSHSEPLRAERGLIGSLLVDAPEQLVVDLLLSLLARPRPYAEVMEVWRTSCPKLPVWEDAVDAGFVDRNRDVVWVTNAGKRWLLDRSDERAVGARR
jgi:hypothetical protein